MSKNYCLNILENFLPDALIYNYMFKDILIVGMRMFVLSFERLYNF